MIKRCFDVFMAFVLCVILSPVLFAIAISIYFCMGRPIFFIQARPGYKGKSFNIIKFRTMIICRDKQKELLTDSQRLTLLGNFLRWTSLDELPELFNIIKGEMSFVGPRPFLPQYLPRYTKEQTRRHDVKPGITGWAQVNGRNAISWEDRFKLDVWYVDHWSLWLDMKILSMTVIKVIKREGITQAGRATMDEFLGNDNICLDFRKKR